MALQYSILALCLGLTLVTGQSSPSPRGTPPTPSGNNSAPAGAAMPRGLRPSLPGGLSIGKGGMDMRQLKSIDPSTLGSSVGSMSQSEQDTVCIGIMNSGGDKRTMAALKNAGVDCFAAMARDPTFKPDASQARMQLEQKRASAPPGNWSSSDWGTVFSQMPDAIEASDIKSMGSSTFRELVSGGNLASSRDAFKDPSKQRAFQAQMKSAYGNPSAWDNSTLRQMGSLIGSMDASDIRQIPAAQMREAASSFKDLSFDDPSKRAAMGNRLIEGLGKDNAASWSADDVKNADQFIRSNPAIIGKLSDSALNSALSDMGSRQTDKRGAAQLGARLKTMSDYQDPTAIDSSKVAKMGQLMQGMGRSYLKNIPTAAISGALSTLANVSFPRGDARELMSKVKGTPSSYSASNIREFGNLITGLDKSDMDQIPASALADSLDDIADKDFDVSQCRSIVSKVKTVGGSSLKKMGKLMARCMTPDDLEGVSIDDLGLNCSDSTAPSFSPDKATAKKLMGEIKNRFGNFSADNTNYTLTCMKNWGKVAALGMDADDIENLPDNGDLGSIFEKLAESEDEMDDTQTSAIAKRARQWLDMDNATAVATYDSTTIAQIGKFMKHFNDSDLEKFNSSVRPEIAKQIGNATLNHLPKREITRLKQYAIKNVLRDDTSTVTDRSSASELDDNDVRDLGGLFTGIEDSDVAKMSNTSISNNMANIQNNVRGLSTQKAVVDRIASLDSTYFDSSDNIIAMAGLTEGIDSTRLASMNQSVLGEALSDAATIMESRETKDKKRDDSGFSSEVSKADKGTMSSNKAAFVFSAFTGYKDAQSTASSSRRKRSTTTITCSDISVLGSNAVSLTTTQIATISTSDFQDCTETLGALTGWSSAQLTELASRAKATYGSTVSSWSAANVKLVGTMLAGLSATEISSLAITSADTLATAGTSSSFSSSQLQAAFSRYLSQARSGTASSVTGDDLVSIGAFACGATTTEIAAFTNANYKTAASSIGQQTGCSVSQLEAYAAQAKTAYGATSTWSTTTISTVGTVIGGLTSSELSALTTSQIAAISTTTIAAIPASKMAAFSTAQLSGFSTAQANSVTADQQNAMSATQRSALFSAGASDLSSAAGKVQMTALFALLPMLVLFL